MKEFNSLTRQLKTNCIVFVCMFVVLWTFAKCRKYFLFCFFCTTTLHSRVRHELLPIDSDNTFQHSRYFFAFREFPEKRFRSGNVRFKPEKSEKRRLEVQHRKNPDTTVRPLSPENLKSWQPEIPDNWLFRPRSKVRERREIRTRLRVRWDRASLAAPFRQKCFRKLFRICRGRPTSSSGEPAPATWPSGRPEWWPTSPGKKTRGMMLFKPQHRLVCSLQ